MKKNLRNLTYAFFAWLIPFVASFFFFTSDGELTIDVLFFKSIMVVIGSVSASLLLISYFKKIDSDFFKEGVVVGIVWFGLNILLDLLILLPMSGMPINDYFSQIGLQYLAIPAMSLAVGTALANKKS